MFRKRTNTHPHASTHTYTHTRTHTYTHTRTQEHRETERTRRGVEGEIWYCRRKWSTLRDVRANSGVEPNRRQGDGRNAKEKSVFVGNMQCFVLNPHATPFTEGDV